VLRLYLQYFRHGCAVTAVRHGTAVSALAAISTITAANCIVAITPITSIRAVIAVTAFAVDIANNPDSAVDSVTTAISAVIFLSVITVRMECIANTDVTVITALTSVTAVTFSDASDEISTTQTLSVVILNVVPRRRWPSNVAAASDDVKMTKSNVGYI
jgi:hypothetical protein